jgi:hypothetical protein
MRGAGQTADEISTSEWTAQHVLLQGTGRGHHYHITKHRAEHQAHGMLRYAYLFAVCIEPRRAADIIGTTESAE